MDEAPPVILPTPVSDPVTSAVPLKLCPQIFLAVCNAVAVPALPEIVVWSPVFVPLELPEKLEADRAPAMVRAPVEVILFDVEKNSISPVEPEPRVTLPDPFAPIVNDSFAPEEMTESATPPAAAADLMLSPVAEDAVEASILNAGFVVPFNPTARALAEAEVIVCAPEVNVPPDTANPPVALATVMFAVPSNDTPPIVLAVCNAVAVPALPEIVVWSPVFVPDTEVVPVTARVGVEEPESTTELTEVGVIAPNANVNAPSELVAETPAAVVTLFTNVPDVAGNVCVVAVPAAAVGCNVTSPDVLPNIFNVPIVVAFTPRDS
jgi:hypothetical protein